jgi:DNA-binding beta-propeller fold protein YncE
VTNFISNTVSGMSIDSTSGALSPTLDSPFATGTSPIAVTFDPAGKVLYVTNISSNNVSGYSIDTGTGVATALDKSPFAAGTRPVAATVDPADKFLYVSNQSSKNITKFVINADTGGLPSSTIVTTFDLAPTALVFAK